LPWETEAGENPAQTRYCNRDANPATPLTANGWEDAASEKPESQETPHGGHRIGLATKASIGHPALRLFIPAR